MLLISTSSESDASLARGGRLTIAPTSSLYVGRDQWEGRGAVWVTLADCFQIAIGLMHLVLGAGRYKSDLPLPSTDSVPTCVASVVASRSDSSTAKVFFAFVGAPVVIGVRFIFLRSSYRDMDQAIPTKVVESNDEEKALLEDFCLQHPALTAEPPFQTCIIMDTQKQHLDALRDSLKDPADCVNHIYVSGHP